VQNLVYKQTTITPEPTNLSDAGFPWNTTIIPLIVAEIEQVITAHTSNEILASIGQKEIDLISTAEQTAAQMRVEITGRQQAYTANKGTTVSRSISRATITERFYHPPFTEKAAALGVHLNWVDIGTWEPSAPIRDKIKSAWKTAADNIKKHGSVEAWKKQSTDKETLSLIERVALSFSDRITARSGGGKEKDKQVLPKELQDLIAKNPELLANPYFTEQYVQGDANKKGPAGIALEMLKAFRKELLAGQELIEEKEKSTDEEDRLADLEKIKKTLDTINIFFQRPPKKP
jgi:hypothetical protein